MQTIKCDYLQQLYVLPSKFSGVEELRYTGYLDKKSAFVFSALTELKRVEFGSTAYYSIKSLIDPVLEAPSLEEIHGYHSLCYSSEFFEKLIRKKTFRKLVITNPSSLQLLQLEKLYEEGGLDGFHLVSNKSNRAYESDSKKKIIEIDTDFSGVLDDIAEKICFKTGVDKHYEFESDFSEEKWVQECTLAIWTNDFDAFKRLIYLVKYLPYPIGVQKYFQYLLINFVEFRYWKIGEEYAKALGKLSDNPIYVPLIQLMLSKLEGVNLHVIPQKFQSWIPFCSNACSIEFTRAMTDENKIIEFSVDMISNPDKITKLELSYVHLDSDVLDLSEFTALEELVIKELRLRDFILPENSCLKKFEMLRSYDKADLPDSLLNCKELEYFNFYDKQLNLSRKFYELTKLNYINISFDGDGKVELTKDIGKLVNLEFLTIINSHGLSRVPRMIRRLEKLRHVSLHGSYASIPEEIFLLPVLEQLHISSDHLDEIPKALDQCVAFDIEVKGSNIRSVPLGQVGRLGPAFSCDTVDFQNRDLNDFYMAKKGEYLPLEKHQDFFNILYNSFEGAGKASIDLYFDVLATNESKYIYAINDQIEYFNKDRKSIAKHGIPKGSKVGLIGDLHGNSDMLIAQLNQLEISWADIDKETPEYLIVGNSPTWKDWLSEGEFVLCSESQMMEFISSKGLKQFNTPEGKQSIAQIENLLYSKEGSNQRLGLEMLMSMGLPKELELLVLVIAKNTLLPEDINHDPEVPELAERIIRAYTSDFRMLSVLDNENKALDYDWDKNHWFMPEKVFTELNDYNQRDNNISRRGYICWHLLWKLTHNSVVFIDLFNKLRNDYLIEEMDYFKEKNQEIIDDGYKFNILRRKQ
ncbi:leucine-rich repeat domain-containing protein [Aureibacter tunicatorum]|uniref:Uncharacterized protein n=1 Tax=Aureibacter tunicatorum TaxID=866807 RepID=A0AAE4BTI1_9BACT|nr:hypothetical protein [Aureibacter tunicatorum]MDR6239863.1 hypothetical protein [Aureibacter tunicatorum]BDD04338.1 hypothetical protein AUTU_18210 [Aureibacter tunicatorum]